MLIYSYLHYLITKKFACPQNNGRKPTSSGFSTNQDLERTLYKWEWRIRSKWVGGGKRKSSSNMEENHLLLAEIGIMPGPRTLYVPRFDRCAQSIVTCHDIPKTNFEQKVELYQQFLTNVSCVNLFLLALSHY